MKIRKLFFLFLIIFSAQTLFAQDIKFDHLTTQNGLSQLSITSIYQDETGSIWIGTREGINRYDGYNIKSFLPLKNDLTIPGNIISTIVGDQNGNIYFACDGKLVNFNLKLERFTTLNIENVISIVKGNRFFWILTNESIYQMSLNQKITFYSSIKKN